MNEAENLERRQLWPIAIEKPNIAGTLTNMDLQSSLQKYTVTYRLQWNPPRHPECREGKAVAHAQGDGLSVLS